MNAEAWSWPRFRMRLLWHSGATLIAVVTTLHIGWAILVPFSSRSEETAPLSVLVQLFGNGSLLSAIFLTVAVLALLGIAVRNRLAGLALMLPQQTVLILAAFGSLQAVIMGIYPDGTAKWWDFILKDQLLTILVAPGYTIAVLTFHNAWRRPRS